MEDSIILIVIVLLALIILYFWANSSEGFNGSQRTKLQMPLNDPWYSPDYYDPYFFDQSYYDPHYFSPYVPTYVRDYDD